MKKLRFVLVLIICSLFSFTGFAQSVQIDYHSDTLKICSGAQITLTASGANNITWTANNLVIGYGSTLISAPSVSSWIYASSGSGISLSKDSVYVLSTYSIVDIVPASNPIYLCKYSDTLKLSVNALPIGGVYNWVTPGIGNNTTNRNQSFLFGADSKVLVSYTFQGCTRYDSVSVLYRNIPLPNLISRDTLICPGDRITLSTTVSNPNIKYSWSPILGINVANIPNPIFNPKVTTTYTVTVTAADGTCPITTSLQIRVKNVNVQIAGRDTLEICNPPGFAQLSANTTGTMGVVAWFPQNGTLSDSTIRTPRVTPKSNSWYYATYTALGCTVVDSIFVRVDSIQEFGLSAHLAKSKYCPGEIVALVSNSINWAAYPDMKFEWLDKDVSFLREEEFGNLVVVTTAPRWYIRKNINHGCESFDSIYLNVIIPNLNPSLKDTAVCQGAMFNITLQNPNLSEIEWTASGDGTVNPNDQVTVKVTAGTASFAIFVKAKDQGCPGQVTIPVTVKPPFVIRLDQDDTLLCKAASFDVSILSPSPLNNITWGTSNGGSLNPSDQTRTTVTASDADLDFNVYVKAKDALGCPGEGGFSVKPKAKFRIAFSISQKELCSDGSFPIQAVSPPGMSNIRWAINGNGASLSPNTGGSTTVTTTGRTNFEVYAAAEDAQGCPGDGIIPVTFTPKYDISVNSVDAITCPNGSFNISVLDNSSMLEWATSSGSLSNTNTKNSVLTLNGTNPATVTIKGKNPQGCDGETTVRVSAANETLSLVKILPQECVGPNDVDAVIGVAVGQVLLPGAPVIWSVDGVVIPNVSGLSARVPAWKRKQSQAVVTAKGTSLNGCPLEASIIVCYTKPVPPEIPNAFSPNGDQKNDVYAVKINDAEINNMKIYNRWGQIVFDSGEAGVFSWDGKISGQEAPVEVYILRLEYTDYEGNQNTIKKDITLIR